MHEELLQRYPQLRLWNTFNSLFEMHMCAPPREAAGCRRPFNSLFEMPDKHIKAPAGVDRISTFNSLFEMPTAALKGNCVAWWRSLSILYLRCW